MTGPARPTEFDDDLFERINTAVAIGDEIPTLTRKQPNWIAGIDRTGIWVETEASRQKGSGPQLVPAWMIISGWNLLRQKRTLSQGELVKTVKRSAFVFALLARFAGVVVHRDPSTILEL